MFPARHPTLRHSLRQLCIHTRTAPFHPATRYTPRAPSRSITTTAIRHSQRTKQCPTCTTPLPLSTSPCPKCATLVPIPTDVSYYSLFNLTPASSSTHPAGESAQERTRRELRTLEGGGYILDTRDLRSRFFKRQQGCHPDSYTGQGKIYELALDQSSFLNKAYSTLADPLTRAQYLLEIYGNPIAETDSLDDPDLLMQVMEAREELEDASTEEEVERVKLSNAEHIQEAMQALAQAFGSDPPDLGRAKSLAIEMQYLKNLERAAREWQPGKRVEVVH